MTRPPLTIRIAIAAIGLLILCAIFADLLAPHDYRAQNLLNRFAPPVFLGGDWAHPLGTDQLGRDLLSRLLKAAQISLGLAILGTIIGAVVGTALGLLAASLRGAVGEAVLMLVDVQAALPFMMIALAVLAFLGNSLILFVAVLGLYGWEVFARLARASALAAREQGYARAISAFGASEWHLYTRHILPNIAAILIVQITLNFPQTILVETSLSFLGLGIRPPLTSLGQILGEGRAYLLTAWWIAVLPGLVTVLATLSISLIGDWLRDEMDPSNR
ncbi:ABC transporter permease [Pontivivens ytuae]|uniref:ABC transporter permease n=1 Tax=Pontivivens ytuae TaxID=2789856 RepID=A0A7S9LTE7_9RHOB|nr:ABC transporter permease [Pontivivens ytuae]QPH54954.1 ABC transporter permease [Pontivivens ytuae]